ncbi:DUF4198 domain-containing protein [Formosa sp. A9]|uniref:DUF4198 domain-containing protein n=1 Tax=Formosa sp. A9 TaxID=3442641 RepID=UPI003EB7949C
MKKLILTLTFLVLIVSPSFAHYLWVETNAQGSVGQSQVVNVYYGEYTYGVIEQVNGEAFPKVKDFSLWVIDANGKKTELQVTAKDDHFTTTFTPKQKGTYTIVLDNDNIEVIDYTKYDFGIFKTHYNASAVVEVEQETSNSNNSSKNGISIVKVKEQGNDIKLQVLFKGKPLAENEATIFVSDLWSKKLTTDQDGYISFNLPWATKYIIETTKKEEVPGKFKGKDYQFIWHCATYCIQ